MVTTLPRRRRVRGRAIAVAMFVALACGVILSACGSVDEETSNAGTKSGEETTSAATRTRPPADGAQGVASSDAPRHPKAAELTKSRSGASPSQPKGIPYAAMRSKGSCPPQLSRAECLANVRASLQSTPSHPVNSPRDCLHAMSRAQCKAIVEDELAATENAGPSFRPEECLRYYTRAECMALLNSQMPK